MEENLTLAELYEILEATREREHERRKFAAALKGVNLDEEQGENSSFEEVKRRAEAKLRGMSEEQLGMEEIGVGYVLDE